jgi:hypothetical protein
MANFDTSLFKKIPLNERFNLQFRAEVFNLFNHANFAYPNEVVFSSSRSAGFGPVCSANNITSSAGSITNMATFSRQIQLGVEAHVLIIARPAMEDGPLRLPWPHTSPQNHNRSRHSLSLTCDLSAPIHT